MRGQGQLLALALAATLFSLLAVDGARVLLQQPAQVGPKVCRYACGRGLTCIDGFCQDVSQLAVISLAPAQAAGDAQAQPQPAMSLPLEQEGPTPEELTAENLASMSFIDASTASSPAATGTGAVSVVVTPLVRRTPPMSTPVEVGGK